MRFSRIRILGWITGGVLVASLLIYMSHPDSGFASRNSEGTGVSTFRFAPIQRGSFEQTTTVIGMLRPVETVEVGSQLSGQIANLYVDFNDKVKVGDPLAQIDPRTFQAKVDEARAALNTALANIHVEEAKLDPRLDRSEERMQSSKVRTPSCQRDWVFFDCGANGGVADSDRHTSGRSGGGFLSRNWTHFRLLPSLSGVEA
jgi:multidrug efflux pump subunit AcrA (membrane-fusion protein)